MNDYMSFSSRWPRRLLIALAIVGLAAVGIPHLDERTPEGISHPSERAHSVDDVRQGPRAAPTLKASVADFDKAANREEPRSVAPLVNARQPLAPQPTPVPFKLLGRIQDGEGSLILLYRGGRILSLRNATPVDDDYVVDALTQDYVVLRQRSTNESQIIQLAARQEAGVTGWSAANLEPD